MKSESQRERADEEDEKEIMLFDRAATYSEPAL
jgi:hypothetical protein